MEKDTNKLGWWLGECKGKVYIVCHYLHKLLITLPLAFLLFHVLKTVGTVS